MKPMALSRRSTKVSISRSRGGHPFLQGCVGEDLATKVKVDLIDKWDRNPTSSDREWDIDEAWLRWGPEVEPGNPHEGYTAYAKLGKFPKFERQDDRHLESYGLVSTSFNRMEDIGLEVGFDLGSHFYLKSSFTQGNPVFFRDVNALAGDNGTPLFDGTTVNPDPKLKSGIPIFYDADVDELSFDNPEVGLGLGFRLNDESGRFALDVLAWGYARDLADTVDLNGTFYGGDLDLIEGPFPDGVPGLFPPTRSPMQEGREKREYGANVWLAGSSSSSNTSINRHLHGRGMAYDWGCPISANNFGRQIFSLHCARRALFEARSRFPCRRRLSGAKRALGMGKDRPRNARRPHQRSRPGARGSMTTSSSSITARKVARTNTSPSATTGRASANRRGRPPCLPVVQVLYCPRVQGSLRRP